MSTSTRIMRSKGKSDGLSLPTRTRPTRKDTTSGSNGGMALNTTCNAGRDQQQQMLTQTPHLTQSPQVTSAHRAEATAPMLPPGPHRPLTPHMPLPTSPTSSSRSSAPLFKEDKYSSTSEEESEADAEVTFIHGRSNGMFANNQAKRPTSTPTTSDYTTQGDPDASPSTSNLFRSTVTNDEFLGTNNIFCARWQQQMNPPDRQQSVSCRLPGKWQQCISPGATSSRENAEHVEVFNG